VIQTEEEIMKAESGTKIQVQSVIDHDMSLQASSRTDMDPPDFFGWFFGRQKKGQFDVD
jgi:hypothetical protein